MKSITILFLISLCVFQSFCQEGAWRIEIDTTNIFSSPRFCDLNKDGVQDLVIGGGVESVASANGILAIDGTNGSIIWKIPARTQIYTSALFQDITGDGVEDVFIGGRAATYYAIDGAKGEIIWEFFGGTENESRKAGYLNFFGTQFIDDQDGDGFDDLLVTNGGDYVAAPDDHSRASARLMIMSSATGKILNYAWVPDHKESYYAPHIMMVKNKPYVVFGTGGETIEGALWRVPLKSLQKNSMRKAQVITQDTSKGFILNSVVTDLNGDGQGDVLSAGMNATISAIDGKKRKVLWEKHFEERECYVTPSLGYFNADKTPDLFTIVATGTFPMYSSFELIVINGKDGSIIYREVTGFNQFSPCIAADLNNDGIDEIVYVQNELTDPKSFQINNRLRVVDLKNNTSSYLGPERPGMSMASTPTIVDLEGDGQYEIIVATVSMAMGEGEQPSSLIERVNIDYKPNSITWPGYLGPNENGNLEQGK